MGVRNAKQNSSSGARVIDRVARHGATICDRRRSVVNNFIMRWNALGKGVICWIFNMCAFEGKLLTVDYYDTVEMLCAVRLSSLHIMK